MEEVAILKGSNCRAKGAAPGFKVAVLGASGGIGQPLSLLMKMNPLVSVLHLYDVVNTPGVTADISHMNTGAVVMFRGNELLKECYLIIGWNYAKGIAKCCPNAIVNVISNPVNSTVPIAAEVFKKAGTYDPKRLLGVTTLDVVRANTFVGEVLGLDPRDVNVPVVGGHAGVTILPLLSQVNPPCSFTSEEISYLTSRIQNGGTEVVEAYAAAKFADACLRGLRGDAGIVECSYIASQVTELPFFASKVRLGRSGVEEVLPLGPLNEFERAGLEKAKGELAESIHKGVAFANK
uniref:Malate dehydrogenase n=1 Tax=Aegilops tauschii TaxID=37682 RepID=M8BK59_AEGTA